MAYRFDRFYRSISQTRMSARGHFRVVGTREKPIVVYSVDLSNDGVNRLMSLFRRTLPPFAAPFSSSAGFLGNATLRTIFR